MQTTPENQRVSELLCIQFRYRDYTYIFHLKGGSSVAIGGRDGLFSLTPLTDSPATAAKDDEDGGGGGSGQQISHLFHYDTGMVTMFLCILPFHQKTVKVQFEGKPLKFEAFT